MYSQLPSTTSPITQRSPDRNACSQVALIGEEIEAKRMTLADVVGERCDAVEQRAAQGKSPSWDSRTVPRLENRG